jgi:hypothetical protein
MNDRQATPNQTILAIHKELEALLKHKEELERHPPLGPLSPSAKRNRLSKLSKAVDEVIRRLLTEHAKTSDISTPGNRVRKGNPNT